MSSKCFALGAFCAFFLILQGCASTSKIPTSPAPTERDIQITNWLKAASKGDSEYIKKNLNLVGTYNINGTTALMAACARGHEETAKILIAAGEDINALDGNKDSALFYTVAQNKENTFDLLLQKKAKANITRADGISPLMIAVDNNRQSMTEKLIKYKVDLNEQTEDGWTALFFTIRMKNLKTAKLLTKAGAKPDIKDKDGKTPLDYARDDNWKEGIEFFQKFLKKEIKSVSKEN